MTARERDRLRVLLDRYQQELYKGTPAYLAVALLLRNLKET